MSSPNSSYLPASFAEAAWTAPEPFQKSALSSSQSTSLRQADCSPLRVFASTRYPSQTYAAGCLSASFATRLVRQTWFPRQFPHWQTTLAGLCWRWAGFDRLCWFLAPKASHTPLEYLSSTFAGCRSRPVASRCQNLTSFCWVYWFIHPCCCC